jgi:hypothetical protein
MSIKFHIKIKVMKVHISCIEKCTFVPKLFYAQGIAH